jgi:hypothetical protein
VELLKYLSLDVLFAGGNQECHRHYAQIFVHSQHSILLTKSALHTSDTNLDGISKHCQKGP